MYRESLPGECNKRGMLIMSTSLQSCVNLSVPLHPSLVHSCCLDHSSLLTLLFRLPCLTSRISFPVCPHPRRLTHPILSCLLFWLFSVTLPLSLPPFSVTYSLFPPLKSAPLHLLVQPSFLGLKEGRDWGAAFYPIPLWPPFSLSYLCC